MSLLLLTLAFTHFDPRWEQPLIQPLLCPRDHENPASTILDSLADLGRDHVTVYISLWHKTTAPLPSPPVRRLLSAPSHGGARCSRSSYTVWVSRRIPRAHPHQGLLPHTGPPGTKSDKVPLFPEHPTCHPWGPPCFREPFFFHQSSKEKLRFSDSLLAPLLFRTEMKIGQPQAFLDEEFHGRVVMLFGLNPLFFLAPKMGRPN